LEKEKPQENKTMAKKNQLKDISVGEFKRLDAKYPNKIIKIKNMSKSKSNTNYLDSRTSAERKKDSKIKATTTTSEPKSNNTIEFEKEFDEEFTGIMADGRRHFIKPDMDGLKLKDFLSRKLQEQRAKDIKDFKEKLAGLKIEKIKMNNDNWDLIEYNNGYNQAVESQDRKIDKLLQEN